MNRNLEFMSGSTGVDRRERRNDCLRGFEGVLDCNSFFINTDGETIHKVVTWKIVILCKKSRSENKRIM